MGRSQDGLGKVFIWVMNFNRTFDTVTFWEVKNHKHYVLRGRVHNGEEKYLEGYLSPSLTEQEKAEIEKIREEQKSLMESMGGTVGEEDYKPDALDDDQEDEDDSDEKEEEDEELKSDSNFENDIEKIINYSDMDQSLKGENINYVGQLEGLGYERKNELKDLNYQDLADGAVPE